MGVLRGKIASLHQKGLISGEEYVDFIKLLDKIAENMTATEEWLKENTKAKIQLESIGYKLGEKFWIPVTEKLPDPYERVLGTFIFTSSETGKVITGVESEDIMYNGEYWCNCHGDPVSEDIIAWMRKPTPYENDNDVEF